MHNLSIALSSILKLFLILLTILSLTYNSYLDFYKGIYLTDLFILIISFISLLTNGLNKKSVIISAGSIGYLLISYFLMINRDLNITYFDTGLFLDYILINKSIYYMVILPFLVTSSFVNKKDIKQIINFLLIVFMFKYFSQKFIFNEDRPWLFTENNFELVFLILVFYLYYILNNSYSNLQLIALFSIVFISGSRSGMACLAFMICMIYLYSLKINLRSILRIFLIILVTSISLYLFISRLEGKNVESIDRIVFFNLFLREINNWDLINYLFGTYPITPLSSFTCKYLSFYSELFSHYNNNTCYSPVLHAYNLRVIYDFGFLGLLAIYSCIIYLLRLKLYSWKQIIIIVGVIFITGLSVSALNSTFVALSFILYLSANRNHEN